MGVVDRKQLLFEGIIRLRRAERRGLPDKDLVAVRAMLEEELGDTMSRRFAARVLGVDHKSLSRWIDAGDIPMVYAASGRMEVPTANVLELYDAVTESRARGVRQRHHLEPALAEGRRRAEQMCPDEIVPSAGRDGHARAERRALAYHRTLARRLRRPMVDDALRLLWKWREQGKIDERYAAEWERVLARPLRDVRQMISEDTPHARDLRQNSPFAGILSEAERRRINEEIS